MLHEIFLNILLRKRNVSNLILILIEINISKFIIFTHFFDNLLIDDLLNLKPHFHFKNPLIVFIDLRFWQVFQSNCEITHLNGL